MSRRPPAWSAAWWRQARHQLAVLACLALMAWFAYLAFPVYFH